MNRRILIEAMRMRKVMEGLVKRCKKVLTVSRTKIKGRRAEEGEKF